VATLTSPYALPAGTYRASAPINAVQSQNPLTGTLGSAPLTAPADGYYTQPQGTFPNNAATNNYWVDLNFQVVTGSVDATPTEVVLGSDSRLTAGAQIQAAAASSSTYAAFQTAIAALSF
jgi:hypothetical protein